MKKIAFHLIILMLIVGFSACKTGGNKAQEEANDSNADTKELPDVSELAFMDIVDLVYPDSVGKPIEWHGEAMPNSLVDSLAITEGDPCGDQGCGKQLMLTNRTDRAIGLMTKADFSIRDRQAYLAREYVIEADQTIGIGCSHLCYNGESFAFPRTIVGSWYMDE